MTAIPAALACAVMILARAASACTTPVHQYALEMWPPGTYAVTVYHRGPLSEAQRAALESMRGPAGAPANVEVRTVDLAGGADRTPVPPRLPWLVAGRPDVEKEIVEVWAGPFSERAASRLVDSPARREIARRLLAGHAAVWVLLECGNEEMDRAAAETLKAELARYAPSATGADSQEQPAPMLSFSVLPVSRKDAAEEAFLAMLLRSEEGLDERADEPIVFPVFGRGRVLYALIGRGINRRVIAETVLFLAGPCACVIKDENPGTDLLMSVDWDARLQTAAALPLLQGAFPDSTSAEGAEVRLTPPPVSALLPSAEGAPPAAAQPEPRGSGAGPILGAAIALVVVALAAAAGTLWLKRRWAARDAVGGDEKQ